MAIESTELFASTTRDPFPRMAPTEHGMMVATFAAAAAGGEVELPVGSPVVFNNLTDLWQMYDQGGTNETGIIRGFVYPDPITIDDSTSGNERLGQILIAGTVHRDDVNTAATRAVMLGTPSEANIDTALGDEAQDPSLRELGIFVKGLPNAQ